MIILRLILNLLLIYVFLKVNDNKNIKELKLSEFFCLVLFIIIIALSLINYISIIQNVVLNILITLSNYLLNYLFPNKIKVNLNNSNIYVESKESILDILKDLKIKRLETILKRYNL